MEEIVQNLRKLYLQRKREAIWAKRENYKKKIEPENYKSTILKKTMGEKS